ncbi:MAG: hypothetical protein IKD55_10315 [Sediminibacterium sp.]|nr:hypothetical protein [Sediminibacterium sp.]
MDMKQKIPTRAPGLSKAINRGNYQLEMSSVFSAICSENPGSVSVHSRSFKQSATDITLHIVIFFVCSFAFSVMILAALSGLLQAKKNAEIPINMEIRSPFFMVAGCFIMPI